MLNRIVILWRDFEMPDDELAAIEHLLEEHALDLARRLMTHGQHFQTEA